MLFYKKCKISAAPIFNTSCIEDPDQVCIRHPDMGPHSMLFAFLPSISLGHGDNNSNLSAEVAKNYKFHCSFG